MSAAPISRFLREFDSPGEMKRRPPPAAASPPAAKTVAAAELAQAAAKIEDAYARGVAAGRAAASAELQSKLEAQRRSHEQQLQAQREAWVRDQAERLIERLGLELRDLELRIADATAGVLKPFLASEIHRQAISQLCEEIKYLLSKDDSITLQITGPQDLLQVIREKLPHETIAAAFSESAGSDVHVVAGETILETRLAAWMRKIEEATR